MGNIEVIRPDPKQIALIASIVDQNREMLRQNALLLSLLQKTAIEQYPMKTVKLTEKLLNQAEMIAKQNDTIVRTLAHPIFMTTGVPAEECERLANKTNGTVIQENG